MEKIKCGDFAKWNGDVDWNKVKEESNIGSRFDFSV